MSELFTLSAAVEITGASLYAKRQDLSEVSIRDAAVDSRKVTPGSLFIALKGDRTDGHLFLRDAESKGAAVMMVSGEFFDSVESAEALKALRVPILIHKDPLRGLQQLAGAHVANFPELVRIGVTGSNGKTTTKEMLAAILSEAAPTVKNRGNLNSEIGLPLAVLHIREQHRFGVFETGVNHPGEMDQMTDILQPNCGVITNVGTAHIGLLGSREGIAREKGRLFSALPADGTGFYPESFEWIQLYRDLCRAPLIPFGRGSTEGIEKVESLGLKGWSIRYEGLDLRLLLPGEHNLKNALAAIQVSRTLGAVPKHIKRGIESMELLGGRSQIIEGPVRIIHDGYNANAESVLAMFETLKECVRVDSLIVVLGAMGELGEETGPSHRKVGNGLAALNSRGAFLLGPETRSAYDEARRQGYRGEMMCTEDFDELRDLVDRYVRPGDTVLLKGSRSMKLERLLPVLQNKFIQEKK